MTPKFIRRKETVPMKPCTSAQLRNAPSNRSITHPCVIKHQQASWARTRLGPTTNRQSKEISVLRLMLMEAITSVASSPKNLLTTCRSPPLWRAPQTTPHARCCERASNSREGSNWQTRTSCSTSNSTTSRYYKSRAYLEQRLGHDPVEELVKRLEQDRRRRYHLPSGVARGPRFSNGRLEPGIFTRTIFVCSIPCGLRQWHSSPLSWHKRSSRARGADRDEDERPWFHGMHL